MSDERPPLRATLHSSDGDVDVSGSMQGDIASFAETWAALHTEPHQYRTGGWQQTDEHHPPEKGRPAYRVAYKTLRIVPDVPLSLVLQNLRIEFQNGTVERGGIAATSAIESRMPRNVIVPEFGIIDEVEQAERVYRVLASEPMEFGAWEDQVDHCNYVEIIYVPAVKDDATYDELLSAGRRATAHLKAMLDLRFGPRLLAMPLLEEAGAVFDDWHWTRRLDSELVKRENQATWISMDGREIATEIESMLDANDAADDKDRNRRTFAAQWYWRAESEPDPVSQFVYWWLMIEALAMDSTHIGPVHKVVARLTESDEAGWKAPVGRLYGIRSKLVHGNDDKVPTWAATLAQTIARVLYSEHISNGVPADLVAAALLARTALKASPGRQ